MEPGSRLTSVTACPNLFIYPFTYVHDVNSKLGWASGGLLTPATTCLTPSFSTQEEQKHSTSICPENKVNLVARGTGESLLHHMSAHRKSWQLDEQDG